jgi:hypothetical protein
MKKRFALMSILAVGPECIPASNDSAECLRNFGSLLSQTSHCHSRPRVLMSWKVT